MLDLSGTPEEVGFLEDSPVRTPESQQRPPSSQTAPSRPKKQKSTVTEEIYSPRIKPGYASRTAEAKAHLTKAKIHLSNSRNLKTDIKAAVTKANELLYQLVKETEAEKGKDESSGKITAQSVVRESKEVKDTKEEELRG